MAEIFLVHAHDPQRYISCYQELATKLPGPPTELLLGNAFMSIQEVGGCGRNIDCASCYYVEAVTILQLA